MSRWPWSSSFKAFVKNDPHAGVLTAQPQSAASRLPRASQVPTSRGLRGWSARQGPAPGSCSGCRGALLLKQESEAGWWVGDGRRSVQESDQPRLPQPAAPEVTAGPKEGGIRAGGRRGRSRCSRQATSQTPLPPPGQHTPRGSSHRPAQRCESPRGFAGLLGALPWGTDFPDFTPSATAPRRSHTLWKHLEPHNEGACPCTAGFLL